MKPLKLLIDSVSAYSPGGERLQVELARALDRTCPPGCDAIVLRRPDQTGLSGFKRIQDECIGTAIETRVEKWRWLRVGLPSWVRRVGATAVFASGGIIAPRVRRQCGVVATTNNLALFLEGQDLSACGPLSRLRLRIARELTVRTLREADRVVLHSEHALRTVSLRTGDIQPKTTVVLTGLPTGADLAARASPPQHPYGGEPYFLYLSAIRWYKNHLGLIEAYRRLTERLNDLPDLILAGPCKDPGYLAEIEHAIAVGTAGGAVRYLGELPETDVSAWLHHASVNVFPSLAETNSLIQAEILGMHGVLATSDRPPMPEVVGNAAAFFDPRDPDAIGRVVERLWLCPEERRRLRRRAAERAGKMSWDPCGTTIWKSAREAADRYVERSR